MIRLKRIVSGGQTGVDQAALSAALRTSFECGGWCPPGRESDSGRIPDVFPLQETPNDRSSNAPDVPRSQRTEWNVRDSDATLILGCQSADNIKGSEQRDSGLLWTRDCARRYGRPLLECDLADQTVIFKIRAWLSCLPIETLNIAGPSQNNCPGVGETARDILESVFKGIRGQVSSSSQRLEDGADTEKALTAQAAPVDKTVPKSVVEVFFFLWNLARRRMKEPLSGTHIVVIFFIFIAASFAAIWKFNARWEDGHFSFGIPVAKFGEHATVDATAAFQNSGIRLEQGQKITVFSAGRVHIAMDQANNLMRAAKTFIVERANRAFDKTIRERYKSFPLDDEHLFYRNWVGPEGESTQSDIFNECKLRRDVAWGALLAVVLPDQVSASDDPCSVLSRYHLTAADLDPVGAQKTITAPRAGWLTFIINEAVISDACVSEDSKTYFSALKGASESLEANAWHRFPQDAIPLICFADNAGAFRVIVSYPAK